MSLGGITKKAALLHVAPENLPNWIEGVVPRGFEPPGVDLLTWFQKLIKLWFLAFEGGLSMRKLLFTLATCSTLGISNVQAADMSFPETYDWSGAYLGVHAGYGWGDYDVSVEVPANIFNPASKQDLGGVFDNDFIGGIHAGYNFLAGQNIVLGLEADLEATGFSGDQDPNFDEFNMKLPVMGSIRARAGYAIDNLLIYGTGGLAVGWADFDTEIQNTSSDNSETFVGFTVGAGVNWGITDNLSAGLEYRYTDLGSVDYTPSNLQCAAGPNQDIVPCNVSGDLTFQTVRASLSYRF
jgi:outer membrane immunogenic protein